MNLTIEPGNPHDFRVEELEALAEIVRSTHPGTEVHIVERPERGYGVTLYEVLKLVADFGKDAVEVAEAIVVLKTVVGWATARWNQDKHAHGTARPRSITLYDGDNKPVTSVTIDEPHGVPQFEDKEAEE
jgi:hypothetical protein